MALKNFFFRVRDGYHTLRIFFWISKKKKMIDKKNYDYVLNIRWEVFFYKPIIDPEINLAYDKFNFLAYLV